MLHFTWTIGFLFTVVSLYDQNYIIKFDYQFFHYKWIKITGEIKFIWKIHLQGSLNWPILNNWALFKQNACTGQSSDLPKSLSRSSNDFILFFGARTNIKDFKIDLNISPLHYSYKGINLIKIRLSSRSLLCMIHEW